LLIDATTFELSLALREHQAARLPHEMLLTEKVTKELLATMCKVTPFSASAKTLRAFF